MSPWSPRISKGFCRHDGAACDVEIIVVRAARTERPHSAASTSRGSSAQPACYCRSRASIALLRDYPSISPLQQNKFWILVYLLKIRNYIRVF